MSSTTLDLFPAAPADRWNLRDRWNSAAIFPPRFTVSEWADAYRRLPENSAARGARWRTSATPYLRAVMDAVHEPGVKAIVLMGGAQVGKSESVHNMLGYFMGHDPCPILFVHPSKDVAEEWSKDRLNDMLETTDTLRGLVDESKSTLTYKEFPGGSLAVGGANTPNTFARRAASKFFADDYERFPVTVGEEGDPGTLLRQRMRTFVDGIGIFVSTPKLKNGPIDNLYQQSDQRRYVVTCPSCQHEDWITWNDKTHFRWAFEGDDASTARLACPAPDHGGCGALHDEPTRRRMVTGGRWRSTATAKEAGLVGFHLPTLISTLGDVTLSGLVEEWHAARARGLEALRGFITTVLAEGWEHRGTRMDPQKLVSRREDYGPGVEVPAGAVALTAGVDVQKDRFEVSVFAWGFAGERWLVDHQVIEADPKLAEGRALLLQALERKYTHALGPLLPIHATAVDTGYATEEMYDFVLAYQARRIYAVKGFGQRSGNPIVMKATEKPFGRLGRKIRLHPINTDDAKADIMSALAQSTAGPNYFHLPIHLDSVHEEYCAQLCSEHREPVYNRQRVATHEVWVLDRERNEALDCAVYALAALRQFNPNIRQMLEILRQAASAAPSSSASLDNVPNATVQSTSGSRSTQRRVARSSYLQQ